MESGKEILKRLEDGRIVAFSSHHSGGIEVQEQCDYYFSVVLSADELRAVAAELIMLADQSEERGAYAEPEACRITSQMVVDQALILLKGKMPELGE